jgi:hypothetical protein
VVVRTHQVLPRHQVPDFVKKMVGETLEVEQTERWEPAQASVRAVVRCRSRPGQPRAWKAPGSWASAERHARVGLRPGQRQGAVLRRAGSSRKSPRHKAAIDKEGERRPGSWLAGRAEGASGARSAG